MRLFFDILHGIDRADIPLVVALEFAILLGYDGQLKQNSDMEKELFQCTIAQLNKTKMTKVENALMWLYVKTWGLQGQHVIDRNEMWNFGGEDLQEAIMGRDLRTETSCRAVRSWSGPRTNLGNQGPTRSGTEYFCVTAYLQTIRSNVDSHIAVR